MKISDGEKLILLMLSELYDRLEINGEIESEFIRSAIFSNNIWAIPWKYSGIPFEDQDDPEIVKEVLDILKASPPPVPFSTERPNLAPPKLKK